MLSPYNPCGNIKTLDWRLLAPLNVSNGIIPALLGDQMKSLTLKTRAVQDIEKQRAAHVI